MTVADQDQVVPFTRDLMKEFLEGEGLAYFRDRDDDLLAFFRGRSPEGSIRAWFSLREESIYSITIESSYRLGRRGFPAWYVRCNEWNSTRSWPAVHVLPSDEVDQTGAVLVRVIAEEQVDLRQGIHRSLFTSYSNNVLSGGLAFFAALEEQLYGPEGAPARAKSTDRRTRQASTTTSSAPASAEPPVAP